MVDIALLEQLADDDRAVAAGVLDDLANRRMERAADDVDADLLVVIRRLQPLERLGRVEERDAAAGDDAFLDRGARRVHRVVDAILALLDLDLGGAADADDGNAARQLGQTLLQLLAVIVRGGLLDLRLDLRDATLDVLLLAGAVDDRRVLLLETDALRRAEHVERDVLELDAEILADDLAAGEDGDVLEHRLAAIAEAGRLDRRDLQTAAQLVDDQGRQGLALDVLGDDEQRLAGLHHRLEQRQHRLQGGELLLVEKDIGHVELADHLLGIGDEIGAEIAAVELHALDDVELGLERLRLLDRDDALVADLLHRLGDHRADLAVAIRRDGADLGDLVIGRDLARALLDVLDDRLDRRVDAALQIHRVHPGGDRLGALADDGLRQHRRGGRAVTGKIAG